MPATPTTDPTTPGGPGGPYTLRNMDWDDLPRLEAFGRDDPHPWAYADLGKVVESTYKVGVVCLSPAREPVGYLVYVVHDGTGREAQKAGRRHLNAGLLRLQVAPGWRRAGVGRFLVDAAEGGLARRFSRQSAAGRVRSFAVVPESWTAPLLFFRALGFRVPDARDAAFRKNPFTFCPDDGVVTERFCPWPAVAVPAAAAPPAAA